jgi:hypothetical protein
MTEPKARFFRHTCETCLWFFMKHTGDANSSGIGRCRKRAPTLNGYPVTFVGEWCGDHKLDENSL